MGEGDSVARTRWGEVARTYDGDGVMEWSGRFCFFFFLSFTVVCIPCSLAVPGAFKRFVTGARAAEERASS